MIRTTPLPTQDRIKELFYYDPDGYLRHTATRNKRARVDGIAGHLLPTGYRHVRVDGEVYLFHRLIWVYHHGDIPKGMLVDHINQNKNDCKIENLRLVDSSGSNRNKPLISRNRTGVTGVFWSTRERKWKATIYHNNRCVHLGTFSTFDDAAAIRKQTEREYGYHENHGLRDSKETQRAQVSDS